MANQGAVSERLPSQKSDAVALETALQTLEEDNMFCQREAAQPLADYLSSQLQRSSSLLENISPPGAVGTVTSDPEMWRCLRLSFELVERGCQCANAWRQMLRDEISTGSSRRRRGGPGSATVDGGTGESSAWSALTTLGTDAWADGLLASGAMEALVSLLRGLCRVEDALRDDSSVASRLPLLETQVDCLSAAGALICACAGTARDAFYKAGGSTLLQRAVHAELLSTTDALATTVTSLSSYPALALRRSFVALRLVQLCLRVGPPGPFDAAGLDLVEDAAIVLRELPRSLRLAVAAIEVEARERSERRRSDTTLGDGNSAGDAHSLGATGPVQQCAAEERLRRPQQLGKVFSSVDETLRNEAECCSSGEAAPLAGAGEGRLAWWRSERVEAPRLCHDLYPWEQPQPPLREELRPVTGMNDSGSGGEAASSSDSHDTARSLEFRISQFWERGVESASAWPETAGAAALMASADVLGSETSVFLRKRWQAFAADGALASAEALDGSLGRSEASSSSCKQSSDSAAALEGAAEEWSPEASLASLLEAVYGVFLACEPVKVRELPPREWSLWPLGGESSGEGAGAANSRATELSSIASDASNVAEGEEHVTTRSGETVKAFGCRFLEYERGVSFSRPSGSSAGQMPHLFQAAAGEEVPAFSSGAVPAHRDLLRIVMREGLAGVMGCLWTDPVTGFRAAGAASTTAQLHPATFLLRTMAAFPAHTIALLREAEAWPAVLAPLQQQDEGGSSAAPLRSAVRDVALLLLEAAAVAGCALGQSGFAQALLTPASASGGSGEVERLLDVCWAAAPAAIAAAAAAATSSGLAMDLRWAQACQLLRKLLWTERHTALTIFKPEDKVRVAALCLRFNRYCVRSGSAKPDADRRELWSLHYAVLSLLVELCESGNANACVTALAGRRVSLACGPALQLATADARCCAAATYVVNAVLGCATQLLLRARAQACAVRGRGAVRKGSSAELSVADLSGVVSALQKGCVAAIEAAAGPNGEGEDLTLLRELARGATLLLRRDGTKAGGFALEVYQEGFRACGSVSRLVSVLAAVAAAANRGGAGAERHEEACEAAMHSLLALLTALVAGNPACKEALASALAAPVASPKGRPAARYQRLGDLLASMAHPKLGPATLRCVLDLLLDGPTPLELLSGPLADPETAFLAAAPPLIANPDVIPMLLRLLPSWTPASQCTLLSALLMLVRGSGGLANKSVCCHVSPPVLDALLGLFPTLATDQRVLALELMREIGSHSITVAQLKRIVRLLQPGMAAAAARRAAAEAGAVTEATAAEDAFLEADDSNRGVDRPAYLHRLLRALRGMIEDVHGPQRYFLFEGVRSGLLLPPMPCWPAPRGYTFCTWLRVEAPAAAGSTYTPCVFSFVTRSGVGIEAFLQPEEGAGGSVSYSLMLRSGKGLAAAGSDVRNGSANAQKGAANSAAPPAMRVGSGREGAAIAGERWTFVAVSHSAGSFGRRAQVTVLLGPHAFSHELPFPSFGSGAVRRLSVACSIADGLATHCLRGQMGCVYVFAAALSEAQLRGVRQLGPDYGFSFQPRSIDQRELPLPYGVEFNETGGEDNGARGSGTGSGRSTEPPIADARDGSLTPLIMLAYNPALWSGDVFFDNTPRANNIAWTPKKHVGHPLQGRRRPSMSEEEDNMLPLERALSWDLPAAPTQPPTPAEGAAAANVAAPKEELASSAAIARPDAGARSFAASQQAARVSPVSPGSAVAGLAPTPRPQPLAGYMHARRLPGTRECVTRDVKDALDSLGGIEVLLPLFAQLDHPETAAAFAFASAATADDSLGLTATVRVLPSNSGGSSNDDETQSLGETIIALLAASLRDSVPSRAFLDSGGLQLIRFCLERTSPRYLTAGTLARLCELVDRLGNWSAKDADAALLELLGGFRAWVFAPAAAQLRHTAILQRLAARRPVRLRRVLGVQALLDALALHFWVTSAVPEAAAAAAATAAAAAAAASPPIAAGEGALGSQKDSDGGSASADPQAKAALYGAEKLLRSYAADRCFDAKTGAVSGHRASGPALRQARATLAEAVALILRRRGENRSSSKTSSSNSEGLKDSPGLGIAESVALLWHVVACGDDESCAGALQLLLRVTDDLEQARRFVVAIGHEAAKLPVSSSEGSGEATLASLLLSLLSSPAAGVRVPAFAMLVRVCCVCMQLEDARRVGFNANGGGNGGRGGDLARDSQDLVLVTSAQQSSSDLVVQQQLAGVDAAVAPSEEGLPEELLRLGNDAWRHAGLPRDQLAPVLSFAQRQLLAAASGSPQQLADEGACVAGLLLGLLVGQATAPGPASTNDVDSLFASLVEHAGDGRRPSFAGSGFDASSWVMVDRAEDAAAATSNVRVVEAFPAICQQVAAMNASSRVRLGLLLSLAAALRPQEARIAVLSLPGWQNHVVAIAAASHNRMAAAAAAAAADEGDVQDSGDAEVDADEASRRQTLEERRVVDAAARLLAWIAGAAFDASASSSASSDGSAPTRRLLGAAAVRETLAVVNCHAELGALEGGGTALAAMVLRHLVTLAARCTDVLEREQGSVFGLSLSLPLPLASHTLQQASNLHATVWQLASQLFELVARPDTAEVVVPAESVVTTGTLKGVADNLLRSADAAPAAARGLEAFDVESRLVNGPVLRGLQTSWASIAAAAGGGGGGESSLWGLVHATVELVGPLGDRLLWTWGNHGSPAEQDAAFVPDVRSAPTTIELQGSGDTSRRRRGGSGGENSVKQRSRSREAKAGDEYTNGVLAEAGGAPWLLVRVLLAIFVAGGLAPEPAAERSGLDVSVMVLQHLIALLNTLEDVRYPHARFEALNVVAQVTLALRATRHEPRSTWVLGALQLLAKGLSAHARLFQVLLLHEDRVSEDGKGGGSFGSNRSRSRSGSAHATAGRGVAAAGSSNSMPLNGNGAYGGDERVGVSRGTRSRSGSANSAAAAGLTVTDSRKVRALLSAASGSSSHHSSVTGVEELLRATDGEPRLRRGYSFGSGPSSASSSSLTFGQRKRRRPAAILWGFLMGRSSRPSIRDSQAVLREIAGEAASHEMPVAELTLEVVSRVLGVEAVEEASQSSSGSQSSSVGPDGLPTVAPVAPMRANTTGSVPLRARLPWELLELVMWRVVWEAWRQEDLALAARQNNDGAHRFVAAALAEAKALAERDEAIYSRLLAETRAAAAAVKAVEASRLAAAAAVAAATERRCQRQWETVLHALAAERGPWGRGIDTAATSDAIHWLLDDFEDALRQRRRLRRNPKGSWHVISARDVLSNEAAGLGQPTESVIMSQTGFESAPRGLWHDLAKYQRVGVAAGDEFAQEEDEPTDLERAASSAEPESTAEDGGEAWEVEVVRPFAVTAGIVSLRHSRGRDGSAQLTFRRTAASAAAEAAASGPPAPPQCAWATQPVADGSWPLSQLRSVRLRLFQQRQTALELFWASGRPVFLNCHTQQAARTLLNAIRRTRPPLLDALSGTAMPSAACRFAEPSLGGLTATEAWVARRISNFEYLCRLNAAAGRTTQDLSQYPVFPWVLADWSSEILDLTRKDTFRDLAWPIGAQSEARRRALSLRWAELDGMWRAANREGGDPANAMPPFHHGTHYSAPGFVLWYLLRLEPFASLHVQLQGGKFDRADRLFDSLPAAYEGCTTNPTDVKECVPELFYLPEVLVNAGNLPLGITQTGERVGDVKLPPWARDAWDFVRQHRRALESEHVSANLHSWIDLVFGCRQRPPGVPGGGAGAVESCNVFFHLTYSGAVDLERLRQQDPVLFRATARQVAEFGQTPAQLFSSPHPQRLPLAQADVVWPIAGVVPGAGTEARDRTQAPRPEALLTYPPERVAYAAVLFVAEAPSLERLVTVDAARVVGRHHWAVAAAEVSPPFKLRADAAALALARQPLAAALVGSASGGGGGGANGGSNGAAAGGLSNIAGAAAAGEAFAAARACRLGAPFAPLGVVPRVQGGATAQGAGNGGNHGAAADANGSSGAALGPHMFAVHQGLRLLFSCGFWDFSFKVTALESGELVQSVARHLDVTSSLALSEAPGISRLVTASRDCTVMVWAVGSGGSGGSGELPVAPAPLRVLYGHDNAVTCVAVCASLDLVASASEDGTVMLSTLYDGEYLRSIVCGGGGSFDQSEKRTLSRAGGGAAAAAAHPSAPNSQGEANNGSDGGSGGLIEQRPQGTGFPLEGGGTEPAAAASNDGAAATPARVDWVGVSPAGYVVSYSSAADTLWSHSMNGRLLGAANTSGERLHAFCFSCCGEVLVTGGSRRNIRFLWAHSLALADDGPRAQLPAVADGSCPQMGVAAFPCAVRAVALTAAERHLLVGLEDGTLRVLANDPGYLRRRLQGRLAVFGF